MVRFHLWALMNEQDEDIISDEYGTKWLVTRSGNLVTPPTSEPIASDSGFTTYDSSRGHCSLCGRLGCRGSCFK